MMSEFDSRLFQTLKSILKQMDKFNDYWYENAQRLNTIDQHLGIDSHPTPDKEGDK